MLDTVGLASSAFLATICEENYFGGVCNNTCKGVANNDNDSPFLYIRNYMCANRHMLETSMACWRKDPVNRAFEVCNVRKPSSSVCQHTSRLQNCVPRYIRSIEGCGETQARFFKDLFAFMSGNQQCNEEK